MAKSATIAKAFKAVNVELYWAQKRINLLILAHVDFDLKRLIQQIETYDDYCNQESYFPNQNWHCWLTITYDGMNTKQLQESDKGQISY